jgi:hypothetical protein
MLACFHLQRTEAPTCSWERPWPVVGHWDSVDEFEDVLDPYRRLKPFPHIGPWAQDHVRRNCYIARGYDPKPSLQHLPFSSRKRARGLCLPQRQRVHPYVGRRTLPSHGRGCGRSAGARRPVVASDHSPDSYWGPARRVSCQPEPRSSTGSARCRGRQRKTRSNWQLTQQTNVDSDSRLPVNSAVWLRTAICIPQTGSVAARSR